MTDINTMNAETRLKIKHKNTGDRLAALLIAIQRLPLDQRKMVLEQYEHNFLKIQKIKVCEFCGGKGEVATDVDDGEGHIMRGVGDKEKCICQIKSEI